MDNKLIPNIICIILGILILFFPLIGVLGINLVIGIPIMVVGLLILLMGIFGDSKILKIIVGFLILIFGILLIVYPGLFAFILSMVLSVLGILLIVYAIISFIRRSQSMRAIIISVIVGIIYFAIGYLIRDPNVLGALVGLTLLIVGLLGVFKNNRLTEY